MHLSTRSTCSCLRRVGTSSASFWFSSNGSSSWLLAAKVLPHFAQDTVQCAQVRPRLHEIGLTKVKRFGIETQSSDVDYRQPILHGCQQIPVELDGAEFDHLELEMVRHTDSVGLRSMI